MNPMTIGAGLAEELEHEAPLTRKVIAAYPPAALDYQPHPKNFTARLLIGHLVEMFDWVPSTIGQAEMDMATEPYEVKSVASVAAALEEFDAGLKAALECLRATPDSTLFEPWTMRNGEKVFFTQPKVAVVRSFVLNHAIHHRAQLMMYLRLQDVAVPSVYGPSADDPGLFG